MRAAMQINREWKEHAKRLQAEHRAGISALCSAGWRRASGEGARGPEGFSVFKHRKGTIYLMGGAWHYECGGKIAKRGASSTSLKAFLATHGVNKS